MKAAIVIPLIGIVSVGLLAAVYYWKRPRSNADRAEVVVNEIDDDSFPPPEWDMDNEETESLSDPLVKNPPTEVEIRQLLQRTGSDSPSENDRHLDHLLMNARSGNGYLRFQPLVLQETLAALKAAENAPTTNARRLGKLLWYIEPGVHDELLPSLLRACSGKVGEDAFFAAAAMRQIAAFGSDEVAEITAARMLEKTNISEKTNWGVCDAVNSGRATPAFRAAVFAALQQLIRETKRPFTIYNSPETLVLRVDREAGAKLLHPLVSPLGDGSTRALRAFIETKTPPPAAPLVAFVESMLADLSANLAKGPNNALFCDALKGLAMQHHPAARPAIEKVLSEEPSPEESQRSDPRERRLRRLVAAVEALWLLEDFSRPKAYLKRGSLPREKLTPIEFDLHSTDDPPVGDGGFDRYFATDRANYSRQKLAGLKRIGATQHAEILGRALSVFGPGGPPATRFQRIKAFAAMSASAGRILQQCEDEWKRCPVSLEALRMLHALRHRQDLETLPAPE